MSEHTREPWRVAHDEGDEYYIEVTSRLSGHICQLGSGYFSEDDARRIVACVNACAGISTEDLESGNVATMARLGGVLTDAINDPEGRLSVLIKQRDEALAALEELLKDHDEDIGMDDFDDNDSVGWQTSKDGNPEPMTLTFGSLRRARALVARLKS